MYLSRATPPKPPNYSLRSPDTTPLAPSTKAGFRNIAKHVSTLIRAMNGDPQRSNGVLVYDPSSDGLWEVSVFRYAPICFDPRLFALLILRQISPLYHALIDLSLPSQRDWMIFSVLFCIRKPHVKPPNPIA